MYPSGVVIAHPKTETEVAQMLTMLNHVYHRDPATQHGMDREFPHLFARKNRDYLYYVALDNRVVSMVGVYPQTMQLCGHSVGVWSIGCVATDPAYEKRGIATQILHQVFKDGSDAGVPLTVISGERGLYRRLDAVPVGSMMEVSGTIAGWESLLSSMPYTTGSLREIAADDRSGMAPDLLPWYQEHAVRFSRSAHEMGVLLHALWFARPHYDMRLLVVEGSGEQAGYVVAYRSLRQPDHLTVMEWGGSPLAILPHSANLLRAFGSQTLTLNLPSHLSWLGPTFRAHGIQCQGVPLQGTVRVLNAKSLLEAVNPLIQDRYGAPLHLKEAADGFWRGTSPKDDGLTLTRAEIPGYLFNPKPAGLGLPMAWTHDLNFV